MRQYFDNQLLPVVSPIRAYVFEPDAAVLAAKLGATLAAEYELRWLPRGTHQWYKFVTPEVLERALAAGGLRVTAERGVIYNLLADRWQLSDDMDVNYMMVAAREDQR